MKVLQIPADSTKPFQVFDLDPSDTLETMQKLVCGYIEEVPLPTDEISLIVNEEGSLQELPENFRATSLLSLIFQHYGIYHLLNTIVGNVVIAGPAVDGHWTDIPESVIEVMKKA